jgi:hypothetical protein
MLFGGWMKTQTNRTILSAMKTLVKEEAQRLLQTLPDDATWDDVQYAILFRQSIARGMADSQAGQGKTSDEVRQHFAKKHNT